MKPKILTELQVVAVVSIIVIAMILVGAAWLINTALNFLVFGLSSRHARVERSK